MIGSDMFNDPRLIYAIAALAVAFLVVTVWLFGRQKRSGRQAAVICLLMSIALHAVIFFLVPFIPSLGGAAKTDPESDDDAGVAEVAVAVFDPSLLIDAEASAAEKVAMKPLPVAELIDLIGRHHDSPSPVDDETTDSPDEPAPDADTPSTGETSAPEPPPSLVAMESQDSPPAESEIGDLLDDWLDEESLAASGTQMDAPEPTPSPAPEQIAAAETSAAEPVDSVAAPAPPALTPGSLSADFANRVGVAKDVALHRTGGDADTEAAVAQALRFLARNQRADGGFDSRAAGSGTERRPLGESRADRQGIVAGTRSDTASTGLALLAMIGAGSTHREGDYSENVYRGLVYLIRKQKSNGSLAGDATLYAANYCHGMAALAMGEAAAISGDPSAIEATRRALVFTRSMQHPTTGGFRYTPGDPGDLSQLGWQAMVIDAGYRAGLPPNSESVAGVLKFLRSVRGGRSGGLAGYRPGEKPTRTMTAEALATRLLMGENVPKAEIFEAEQFLLEQPPGLGQDNYYYWYYATLALHQLQDAAWRRWNASLKKRLLETQQADGSWPTDSVWGGYGGSVYTTAMATLCLESYYRHSVRSDAARITQRPTP